MVQKPGMLEPSQSTQSPPSRLDPADLNLAPPSISLTDRVPFAIGEPRLCRKIHGFGSFDPMEDQGVKAGRPVLVYCELVGLRYQTQEKAYISRLSSKVELSTKDGNRVWEQSLGEVEDVCRSRRRDNYLGCRLNLPESLAPGEYRLKLIQTDLVARETASAEVPLSIVR